MLNAQFKKTDSLQLSRLTVFLLNLTGPYFLAFLPATVGSLEVRIFKPMMAPIFKIAPFFFIPRSDACCKQ